MIFKLFSDNLLFSAIEKDYVVVPENKSQESGQRVAKKQKESFTHEAMAIIILVFLVLLLVLYFVHDGFRLRVNYGLSYLFNGCVRLIYWIGDVTRKAPLPVVFMVYVIIIIMHI